MLGALSILFFSVIAQDVIETEALYWSNFKIIGKINTSDVTVIDETQYVNEEILEIFDKNNKLKRVKEIFDSYLKVSMLKSW